MPFLKRGKARARQYRAKPPPTPPVTNVAIVTPPPPEVEPVNLIESSSPAEETKVPYQEVTYRVPKEERLLDLPLEEEVFGEENLQEEEATDKNAYNIQPVGEPVSIGAVLKKKKRR